MADLDLTEAIALLALHMTGRRRSKYEHSTWDELGPDTHAIYREEAKEVVQLIAPILERQNREQIAQEMQLGTIAECWPSMHGDGPVAVAIRELRDRLIAIARGDIAADTETSSTD